ncbi:YjiH family protein [Alteribacter keqinensis]|uniref:YjiH family protein n=1 Tax=Alteribacter keqinensis TaxID=2483800 RepID=A0A3M7TMG8_9BACI|nr:YjiH family protein [Alteribacter keqinensis]RNA66801.1 YjiH family protein [Alteribacter keqinensis]
MKADHAHYQEKFAETKSKGYTLRQYLTFIIPSLIGILLFLVPMSINGTVTIGLGVMADGMQNALGGSLPVILVGVLAISGVASLLASFAPASVMDKYPGISAVFRVPPFWLTLRLVGGVFAVMTLMEWGPALIGHEFTGGVVLYDLLPVLAVWFLFASLFMPLLLEYGLMDFIGTLVRKVMQPLFKLPGRSSVDAMASWMGSGTVGVLLTTKQYEDGYYSKREAAVVATNFSIASIAFSLVIANVIGIEHRFVEFYFTVIVAGLAAAVICPRIPPLSWKKDTYYEPVGQKINEETPSDVSTFKWAVTQGVEKAQSVKSVQSVAVKGVRNVVDIWVGLLPLVMALGTVALIVAEFTPVFNILSAPLVPVLELLRLPEAEAAAPAMIVGFADMFLPAVIGSGIESELTRFVIGVLSLTQLIYMSEIGILLIRSKIPLTITELAVIFIQRTLITLPIAALMAHLFFF